MAEGAAGEKNWLHSAQLEFEAGGRLRSRRRYQRVRTTFCTSRVLKSSGFPGGFVLWIGRLGPLLYILHSYYCVFPRDL